MREKSLALLVAGGLAAALFTSSAFAGTDQDCDQDAMPHHASRVHAHHAGMHHVRHAHPAGHAHAVLHRHVVHRASPRAEPVKVSTRCPAAAPGRGDCPCANPAPADQKNSSPDFTYRPGEWVRLQ